MPRLDHHLAHSQGLSIPALLHSVLSDANHQKALMLSASMMFASFTVIPYITIYMQTNRIMAPEQIPYIYLCGGVATLFWSRWVGIWTDRLGKLQTFRRMAVLSIIPLMLTTLMQPVPLVVALLVSTAFFLGMNGRMIPGMALLTSAADPQRRGTFMTLNGAVQSAAMGLASLVGGMLIQRDAQGQVTHYWLAGLAGVAATLLAYWLAGRVRLHASATR
jgi:predicted MFS family arabinose efflux permease